ncbi:cell death activator CIDE-A [Esox lucius]|uniref:cell death activator CIDE-A n=1 Tax=Esox lucius TaxID=8010 RepID=UPI0005764E5C|nr:cell death activator CIDE-A [Esox lucius]
MATLFINSSVEYAKNLLPVSFVRSVATIQRTISRRILPQPQPRSFEICTKSRNLRREVVVTSLDDLLHRTASAFLLTWQCLSLVLEDDGTVVDSEAIFQSLPSNTRLMVLQEGDTWLPVCPRQAKENGVAKLSFHLYKLNPKDFFGCLSVNAALYEMYTLSYDFKCPRAKDMLTCVLRCLMHVVKGAGELLLSVSSYIFQCVGEDNDN